MDSKANLLKDFQLLRLRSLSSLSIFILLGLFCDLGVVFRVVKFMVVNFILYFFFLSISYYIINQWSWWIYSSEAINQYSHYRFSVKSLHTPDWVSSLIWRAWSSWSSCSSSLWLSVGRFTSTSLSRTTWTLLQTVNRKYYDAIMKWLNILSLQIMRTMVCQSATKTRIVLLAFVVWHKIGRRRRV